MTGGTVTPQILLFEAEGVFFRGMVNGYASGEKPKRDFGQPGWKWHEYIQGNWRLLDKWYADKLTRKSFGRTEISHQGRVIWFMRYEGVYIDAAIPCLKDAIHHNYDLRLFEGGRGPEKHSLGRYVYGNEWSGSFANFEGHEAIQDKEIKPGDPNRIVGWHKYGGMSVI